MSETMKDQIERVRAMVEDGQQTWDLSDNDVAALKALLTAYDASEKALTHLGQQMQDNPDIGYYCGYGTQVFYLTARAVAANTGKPLDEVEKVMREDRQPSYRRVEPEVIRLRDKIDEMRREMDHVPDHRAMR